MKKTKLYFNKSLSVFMAAMMLFTAWVFVAPEKADAALVTDTFNLLAYTAITDGSGSRGSSSQITVCSDGEVGNTTVGNIEFNIASFTKPVKKATLNVNTTRNSGTAANSTVKFYLINPSKSLAKSDTYVLNNIASVYGGYYNSATGVNNAYTYFGVSESQALGTIKQTETGAHNFDVTDAVNTAIANGWSRFCLAFIMPQRTAIAHPGQIFTFSTPELILFANMKNLMLQRQRFLQPIQQHSIQFLRLIPMLQLYIMYIG